MPTHEFDLPTVSHLIHSGLVLPVRVGFDDAYDPELSDRVSLPDAPHNALVDTGALESCIDSNLAESIGLPAVDIRTVSGVSGQFDATVYLAQIHVPDLRATLHGRFAGVRLIAGGLPYRALLGRTFLRNFTLIYAGRSGRAFISNDPLPAMPRGL